MNYWLRFGLPIGSAFVTAVILDNIIAVDAFLKEVILASANETTKESISSYNYQPDQYPVLYVFLRTVLSLSLWGILVKAPKTMLFMWIIAAVILDSLRHGNMKMMFDALSSFNIYLLALMPSIRVYLFLIIIEVARVIEKQKEPRLLVGSYEGADDDLESLVPIGYDSLGIWKYYIRFHVTGTRILILVDLVWFLIALPAIKTALGGFVGFLVTLLGFGLDAYAIASIIQRQPSGIVVWRVLFLISTIIILITFGYQFTRDDSSEQGTISTLILAVMFVYKVFLYWFSNGIERSMEPPQFSSTNDQLAQIEAGDATSSLGEVGYQVSEGDWGAAPLTPLSGRVIITELEGRESRTGGWSGRVSRASHLTWGSQPGLGTSGLGLTSSREGRDSRSGWGGSQSGVSDNRDGRSEMEAQLQSQSVRTSREAIVGSTVSSINSGWTTASQSGRDSRSDIR